MALRVDQELVGEALVLALHGRLDAESGEDLELAVLEAASRPHALLLIDCADLVYASAAGLDKLKAALARLPSAHSPRLCSVRAEIKEAFASAGLSLPIYPSREEALTAQRLRDELALVDRVAAILRPERISPANLPETFIEQAAQLLGVGAAEVRPAPSAGGRDEPVRPTWVTERPSLLLRRTQSKKRHPIIRWLRRLIGERD